MPASAVPFIIATISFFSLFMLTLGGAWIATSRDDE